MTAMSFSNFNSRLLILPSGYFKRNQSLRNATSRYYLALSPSPCITLIKSLGLNYRDAEENFVANAFSHKFRADDSQFGRKFVELAETAATGRALADAGFGLQFAD